MNEVTTERAPGMSVRLKLTLSYAGFLMLAGVLLLGAVWLFLLRYVPDRAKLVDASNNGLEGVFPVRSNLLHVFAPRERWCSASCWCSGWSADGSWPVGCSAR